MTRKALLVLLLFAFSLVGACPKPTKLIRLTVVNRSGLPVEISLTGNIQINDYEKSSYYLRLPKNILPNYVVKEFTIYPDKYSMKVYYVELWDPVYGTHCSAATQMVEAFHNTRVVVPVCTYSPPNHGEPSMLKIRGQRVCPKFRPHIQVRKPGC